MGITGECRLQSAQFRVATTLRMFFFRGKQVFVPVLVGFLHTYVSKLLTIEPTWCTTQLELFYLKVMAAGWEIVVRSRAVDIGSLKKSILISVRTAYFSSDSVQTHLHSAVEPFRE